MSFVEELKEYVESSYGKPKFIYLDLYIKRVRLVVFSDEFDQYIYNQIPYIISKDNSPVYDESIFLWKEKDKDAPHIISEYDEKNKTYYYGVYNLEYNEFIKQGHFLVQILYKILKTDKTSLVHGAVVGLNNEGALFCARGQRGKSTLTVLSMLNGMEYVSDDYLFLEKDDSGDVYASPLYSIITLSPIMSEKLKDKMAGAIKLGDNARGDKFVYNISYKHDMFRKRYPIKCLIFPEIVDDDKPFIRKATISEKGRAMTQLIHSTTLQMQDMLDRGVSKKIIEMVNKFDCYYMGLSKDIEENSNILKKFMSEKEYKKHEIQD